MQKLNRARGHAQQNGDHRMPRLLDGQRHGAEGRMHVKKLKTLSFERSPDLSFPCPLCAVGCSRAGMPICLLCDLVVSSAMNGSRQLPGKKSGSRHVHAAAPPLDKVAASLEAAVRTAPTVETAAAVVASDTEMLDE